MTTSTHRPDHDTFEGTSAGFALSNRDSLVPLDERKVRRVATSDAHMSSSGPLHEAPNYLDIGSKVHLDATSTIDIGSHNPVGSVISFLREIGCSDEIRLLEMSGDYRKGLKLSIRHLRPSELGKTLWSMDSVREVIHQGADFAVELDPSAGLVARVGPGRPVAAGST